MSERLSLRRYRISESRHRRQPSCDEQGAFLGSIPLLTKSSMGWVPRTTDELNQSLSTYLGYAVDIAAKRSGLAVAAKALNRNDLVLARIATVQLALSDLDPRRPISESFSWFDFEERTGATDKIGKAAPDDLKHPGWPTGTSGGLGGKFRPTDGSNRPGDAAMPLPVADFSGGFHGAVVDAWAGVLPQARDSRRGGAGDPHDRQRRQGYRVP